MKPSICEKCGDYHRRDEACRIPQAVPDNKPSNKDVKRCKLPVNKRGYSERLAMGFAMMSEVFED